MVRRQRVGAGGVVTAGPRGSIRIDEAAPVNALGLLHQLLGPYEAFPPLRDALETTLVTI